MPTVPNEVRDEKRNITVRIMAYRKLSEREIRQTVAILFSGKKKPKKNTLYTVVSLIGSIEGT